MSACHDGRLLDAHDVARVVAFLPSDVGRKHTVKQPWVGQTLRVPLEAPKPLYAKNLWRVAAGSKKKSCR